MKTTHFPALALALVLATTAYAQPTGETPADDAPAAPGRPAQPLWEAGLAAFGADAPAYPGAAQRTRNALMLPFFIYRGQVLRAERGTVGVRAARTERMELDIGFSGSFGSAAASNDARRGLPDIGTLVEFGPRLRWRLGPALGGRLGADIPLRGVFDLSNRFEYRGLALEPALNWGTRVAGFNVGTSLGLLIADQKLADTFYGVAPVYATVTRPAYEARAGLVATRLAFNVSRRLGPDWTAFAFARVDSVRQAANRASPLVDEPTGGAFGIGLSWTFARSERAAEE